MKTKRGGSNGGTCGDMTYNMLPIKKSFTQFAMVLSMGLVQG